MKELKILMIVNILCVSAMMAFLSIIAPLIRELNLQEWHAGLTVALGGILWVLLSRYWGKKSDKIGRKPILLIGVVGIAISYLILAVFVDFAIVSAPNILISLFFLLLTRGAIGAFYSAITPVSNALIGDHVNNTERTSYIAKLSVSNGIGMIIGPVIGGFLAVYGLETPLYIFAFLPFIAALMLYFMLPNEKPNLSEDIPAPKIFDERLHLPMFSAFITMFAIVTSQVCLGFYIIDMLNFDLIQGAKETGFVLSCIGVVFIISQIIVAKTKTNPYFLLKFGSIIATFGYIIVFMMSSKLILIIGFCIATFGMGMIFPAFQTLALNLVSKKEQGVASGTVAAAQGFGMVIGPLLSTLIYGIHPTLPFIFIAFSFAILAFTSFIYKQKEIIA